MLVTVIIAVLSVAVIPSLKQSIDNFRFKSLVKETYSTLSRATNEIISENAGSLTNLNCNAHWEGGTHCLVAPYLTKLNYIKHCSNDNIAGNCFMAKNNIIKFNAQYFGAGSCDIVNYTIVGTDDAVILQNGVALYFKSEEIFCKDSDNSPCGRVAIDVNGLNPPNKVGTDIFFAEIKRNGMSTDIGICWSPCSLVPDHDLAQEAGATCIKKVLMNKDY